MDMFSPFIRHVAEKKVPFFKSRCPQTVFSLNAITQKDTRPFLHLCLPPVAIRFCHGMHKT